MLHDFFLANKNEFTDPEKEFNKLYDENKENKNIYYGQYGNCYVVQIIDAYADFPAVESECVVAGIVVKYSGPHIIVWERTDFEY